MSRRSFGATVWYSYTAPRDQRLLAAFGPTDGAFPFEFRMAVYDEDTRSLPGGRALTRGPACDFHEPVILEVAAGETLWFQLGGAGFPGERGKGLFRLHEIAPDSMQDPRCALAPVSNLRGGTFFDRASSFYGAVLWDYDGGFTGHFELRYEPLVGERAASPLSLIESLPASASGSYRFDFPFLVASTVRCFEVKPVVGELAGPSRRTCLTANTPRLPGTSPPEPPTTPPGPPKAGNSMTQERADAGIPLLLAGASLCLAVGALLALAVRQARGRL
jgi:hypothetical protein